MKRNAVSREKPKGRPVEKIRNHGRGGVKLRGKVAGGREAGKCKPREGQWG